MAFPAPQMNESPIIAPHLLQWLKCNCEMCAPTPKYRSFTLAELHQATYGFSECLGQGAFGTVYKGTLGGRPVAVKKLGGHHLSAPSTFNREFDVLSRVRHHNLIGLLGYYWSAGQSPMLVMDYMQNGSLDKRLFDASRGLTWDGRKLIALGVARGLKYLHHHCNPTIIHLDIKPDNILLGDHLIPKIGDFGISKIMDINSGVARLTGYCGTLPYMAPELMLNRSPPVVGPHADVYSFGLLLMEIIRGIRNQSPGQPDFRDIAHKWTNAGDVRRLYEYAFPSGYSRGGGASRMLAISIMCTKAARDQRPSMSQVVEMLEGRRSVPPPTPNFFSV